MTSTDKFLKALAAQRASPSPSAARGCYGRIVRTRAERPWILAEETERRAVMVMGPGALCSLIGKSGYEMVVQVGHTEEYIATKLAQGYKYHVVVFKRPPDQMQLATWKNTLALAATLYPQAAPLFKASSRALKATPYAAFEKAAGFPLSDADANGPTDPRYMTLERLLATAAGDDIALKVRRFLFHALRLSELYTGDGYTRTHQGERGVREYIMANRALSDLPESRSLKLEVLLPSHKT
jgi:hypothetical protein